MSIFQTGSRAVSHLLVITPSLGASPHLGATCASVAALGEVARHVVIGPPGINERVQSSGAGAEAMIERERRGLYPAINEAVRTFADAATEWITWINDDDVLADAGVRTLLRELGESNTDVGYGRVRLIDSHAAQLGWLPVAHEPRDLLALLARGIMPLAQPGTLMRRSLFERLGGLDESYQFAADLDLFVRALQAQACFHFHDGEVASFRLHGGQLSKRETEAAAEAGRVFESLRRGNVPRRNGAWWRFRVANAGAYLGRIRRFGFQRMRKVYRHA